MFHNILFALWFLLPGALANASPIGANKIPLLNKWDTPIDGGRQFGGQDILGSHKTWRGIFAGVVTATLVFWLQQFLARRTGWAYDLAWRYDYINTNVLVLGPLFAIGALGGDMVESFFKRRRKIQSGKSWLPFDQIDYIIGSIIVTLPFVFLPLVIYIYILLVWFLMHLIASYLGWRLHLKDAPI